MKKPTWRVEEVCRVLRMQGARARVEERVLVLATMVIGTAWRRLSSSEDLTTIGSLWSMVLNVDTALVPCHRKYFRRQARKEILCRRSWGVASLSWACRISIVRTIL